MRLQVFLSSWVHVDISCKSSISGSLHVRAETKSHAIDIEIVLDSGADVSVMPFSWKQYGNPVHGQKPIVLRDAQGHHVQSGSANILY